MNISITEHAASKQDDAHGINSEQIERMKKAAMKGRDVCCGDYTTSKAYKEHKSVIKQLISENRALRLASGKTESRSHMKEEEHEKTVNEMYSEKEELLLRYQQNNSRLHSEIENLSSQLEKYKNYVNNLGAKQR
eukprot:TRINITY_DN1682_c0_g1_i1.p1 TRINITY_DN1682_c0_g1~~TRINITY_DN1682_c0_g1_i1.p1  ORF type:complete len:135 (+),score=19.32 TRINITY_DN1682_c0_g1_i1:176-580(+)